MKTGAIITAGGKPENVPDYDLTFIMGETSAIKKIIITLQKAKIEPIVIVTGYKADEIEKHAAGMGAIFLRNENYMSSDMFDAVRTGVGYLKAECERIFVIPADIPTFSSASLDLLMNAESSAVCPSFKGKPGHPILIKNDLYETILDYQGTNGLWGAVTSGGSEVAYINVEDEGVLLEADTEENLKKLMKLSSKAKESLRHEVELKLGRNEMIFDPFVQQFLETVNRANSIQTACKQMHISYSKGLKMISRVEKETGVALLERHAGGSEGGVSFLTPKGREFVYSYICMKGELEVYAEQLFEQYFKDFRTPGVNKRRK
jgi:molybdate transport repressor ModE-like protein